MTLEQIEEMRIPVGTPIELTVNYFNGSGYSRKMVKKLVYFGGVVKRDGSEEALRTRRYPEKTDYGYYLLNRDYGYYLLNRIEEIKILKYQ